MIDLRLGDCLDALRTLETGSVDAVVTDPPAGIGFMGKSWDGNKGGRTAWVAWLSERMTETRRVAKPGSYALVWALPRTSHWTAFAIEDAGWVIRDRVSHLFGTGFPKAKSCLKPACEDWWLAWNPAERVTPLRIDDCRIGSNEDTSRSVKAGSGNLENWRTGKSDCTTGGHAAGRWPANVNHDGSPEVLDGFPETGKSTGGGLRNGDKFGGGFAPPGVDSIGFGDSGSAARFFYCAKASKADRGEGNIHPTVKNTDLMRWLCRLITPPGGTVLDCFMGSGSTGKAAVKEGFGFVGVEQNPDYYETARRRIEAAQADAA